ncbi:MAG: transposase [Chloroflexota bacterium]|nr:transposase [Chloroflexota bacterium]
MPDILALLLCLHPWITATTARQLSHITLGMLTMTGRVTMLGIARWTGDGGSYRTIQRFFATALPWAQLFWCFFRQHLFQTDEVYLLAGDEVVVTKAGKTTHGLGRFFSSIYQRTVPGLAFFSLALISTTDRRAIPMRIEQVVRTEAEQAATKAKRTAKQTKDPAPKRKPGRPKGSKNTPKAASPLSPELQRIQTLVQELLQLSAGLFPLTHLLLDGHFGNSASVQLAQQCGLHLISKLRTDAALYLPYDGPYQGRGPRRKYGAKLDYQHLPEECLQQLSVEGVIDTRIYQAEVLHKEFGQPLNVVIIEKVNRSTQKRAHVILFSSDLTLSYATLIDYYGLRFQIEFTFRDAKQYWGLDDFMSVTATGVTNAANLALFMVNLSAVLLAQLRQQDPQCSVLDLKAFYRGSKYVTALIKLLPESPDEDLMAHLFHQMAQLGRIHPSEPQLSAA